MSTEDLILMPGDPELPPRIRAGVIGTGVMGRTMLEALTKHSDYSVTAVADVKAEILADVQASYPRTVVRAAKDLVAADDVDLVYIATPPGAHAELSVPAMEAGKSVLCEKPLAVSDDDAMRMCDVAERTGALGAVEFPLSQMPATRALERALSRGDVGSIRGVDVRLTFPVWPRPFQATADWVGESEEGGFIREVFTHFAYLTDRLCGPIEPLTTGLLHANAEPGASESAAYGVLRAGDVPIVVSGHAGVAAAEYYEWTLWGSEQSYLLKDGRSLFVSTGAAWRQLDLPDAQPYEDLLTHVALAIRGGDRSGIPDFATGMRIQQVVESFHRL
jgi:predicted dehydrogenase